MKTIKQIIFFSFGFLITLCFCEIFIRYASVSTVSFSDYYNDIGKGLRKNMVHVNFSEGFGINKFNEYRYIGEAHPPLKPKNTFRIALIGDSYVQSLEIFDRNYFGNVAEGFLKKQNPGINFEFLNFGRASFNIGNMYAYQKLFVDKFDPDYCLYFISNTDLEPDYVTPLLPKAEVMHDSLIVSLDFNQGDLNTYTSTKFLTQNFAIFNMLNNCRKIVKETPIQAILLEDIYTWIYPNESYNKREVSDTSDFKFIPITKKIIADLDTAKVILINRDYIALPSKFTNACKKRGIKYIDLSPILQKLKSDGNDPNKWEVTNKIGHWNQNTHEVLGKEIAKQLENLVE
jgi:hypothetical protein